MKSENAPRTQGRELAEQIVSTVFPSMDRECAARYIGKIDSILATQIIRCKTCSGTVMFKPLESGEIEIYHDCPDSKKLAQARTQPALKCPKCGSLQVNIHFSLIRENGKHWIMCRDCSHSEFFTAFPKATKEEK